MATTYWLRVKGRLFICDGADVPPGVGAKQKLEEKSVGQHSKEGILSVSLRHQLTIPCVSRFEGRCPIIHPEAKKTMRKDDVMHSPPPLQEQPEVTAFALFAPVTAAVRKRDTGRVMVFIEKQENPTRKGGSKGQSVLGRYSQRKLGVHVRVSLPWCLVTVFASGTFGSPLARGPSSESAEESCPTEAADGRNASALLTDYSSVILYARTLIDTADRWPACTALLGTCHLSGAPPGFLDRNA